jgi:hypothetical protein
MTTHDYRLDALQGESAGSAAAGSGWISFAGVLLGLAGMWNVLEGILAIGSSRVYAADSTFVFSDLNTWGWIVLILGAIQLIAAFAIGAGSELARWFGVAAAFVNSIGQLLFLPAYPFWAITMFALDVIIIYALVVYGGRQLREA